MRLSGGSYLLSLLFLFNSPGLNVKWILSPRRTPPSPGGLGSIGLYFYSQIYHFIRKKGLRKSCSLCLGCCRGSWGARREFSCWELPREPAQQCKATKQRQEEPPGLALHLCVLTESCHCPALHLLWGTRGVGQLCREMCSGSLFIYIRKWKYWPNKINICCSLGKRSHLGTTGTGSCFPSACIFITTDYWCWSSLMWAGTARGPIIIRDFMHCPPFSCYPRGYPT